MSWEVGSHQKKSMPDFDLYVGSPEPRHTDVAVSAAAQWCFVTVAELRWRIIWGPWALAPAALWGSREL